MSIQVQFPYIICLFSALKLNDSLPNTSIQENSSIPLVVKTLLIAYILPVSQLTENIVYQTHITLFSVLSTPEIQKAPPWLSESEMLISQVLMVSISFK